MHAGPACCHKAILMMIIFNPVQMERQIIKHQGPEIETILYLDAPTVQGFGHIKTARSGNCSVRSAHCPTWARLVTQAGKAVKDGEGLH